MKNVMTRINDFGNKYSGILAVVGLFIPCASWGVTSVAKWQWLTEHKECFRLAGVVVGLCVLLVALFFGIKALRRGQWWARRRREKIKALSQKLMSISALQLHSKLNFEQLKLAKEKIPICIVDDRNAAVIKREISDFGYKNVVTRKDFPPDEELLGYSILILDVDGVGTKRDSNGISFALKFKELHPLKQLIMVSGYFSDPKYAEDVERAKGKLDGFFTKGTSYDTCMRPILEKCLGRVVDPCEVWCLVREKLILEALKNDATPYVKLLEDEFVRRLLEICNEHGALTYDWVSLVLSDKRSLDLIDTLRKYGAAWNEKTL